MDPSTLSIAELGRRFRARELSPVDATRRALERIARVGPALGAFVTVTAEAALEAAARAEKELRAGHDRGPLHGVPYGLKDVVDTAGVRTTLGARPYRDRVPDRDATVVVRLREAGAVLVGKTACIELAGALGCSSASASFTPPTRNPWDLARWAGGSSGGSAAAVAAGLVPFALGTETLGSLLCPAAFSGVTGVRPTFGLVSRRGVTPFAYTMDKVGALARSAEDGAAVLSAIAGRDPGDPISAVGPTRYHARIDVAAARRLRVGVVEQQLGYPLDPSIAIYFQEAVTALGALGARIRTVRLPPFPLGDMADAVANSEAADAFADLLSSGRVRELDDPDHRSPHGVSRGPLAADYVRAMRLRTRLGDELMRLFDEHDVLVSLNSPIVAPRVDRPLPDEGGDVMRLAGNLAGLPAVAVPMGFAPPGRLPVSFQIVGRPLSDSRVLSLAAAYQATTGWHRERPPER